MAALILGVDIGGTNIKAATFDAKSGELQGSQMIPTEADKGFPDALDRAFALAETFVTKDVTSIGLCVAGPVQQPAGVLLRAPNIPKSEHIDLKTLLTKKFSLPCAVANDAQCFTLAEALMGKGKGHRVVCGVTIGTGVGGGVVTDGTINFGAHGYAGEIGHMLLMPGTSPTTYSEHARGDIEEFLSGTAFAERCKEAKSPDDFLTGDACAFLHPEVFREIAWMCTNITHAYDPEIIVFGGSTGKALKPHLKAIEKELKHWLLPSIPSPLLAVTETQHPGALGAALLLQAQ